MKKAYMVSHGSYSDYRIFAVFDNEEEADKMVELFNKRSRNSKFQVEEVPFLSKFEDYQPEKPEATVRATYDLRTKRTTIETEGYFWEYEFEDSEIDSYVMCCHSFTTEKMVCEVSCRMPLTANNFMKIEKVLADKVAEAEYELMVTHKSDMESFAKHINQKKEK